MLVSELDRPDIICAVLDGLAVRLDGKPAQQVWLAAVGRSSNTAAEYAVERGLRAAYPPPALKWRAPKTVHAIDRRSVVNRFAYPDLEIPAEGGGKPSYPKARSRCGARRGRLDSRKKSPLVPTGPDSV